MSGTLPRMPHPHVSVRRALASVLLVVLTSAAPTVASAQSLSSDEYVLDPYASTLTFGNGALGSTPASDSSSYPYGGGSSGNTAATWYFGCFILHC